MTGVNVLVQDSDDSDTSCSDSEVDELMEWVFNDPAGDRNH